MVRTVDPANLVAEYFRIWRDYDLSAISRIFAPDGTYVIHSIHRTIRGHREISDYFLRNKRRQKDLSLDWAILHCAAGYSQASFRAKFFDREEGQRQTIKGIISFSIDSNGQIRSLSEAYEKVLS